MCLNYKLRLKSSKGLCKEIEKTALQIKGNLEKINKTSKEYSSLIRKLKKLKISSGNLDVQKVSQRKKTKELKNLYKEETKQINSMNKEIVKKTNQLLCLIKTTSFNLDKINFNADSLIYREDYRISLLIKRLIKKGQNHKIILNLNMLKGQIKTVALRLFEASKFEQKSILKYPSPRIKVIDFADKIKQISASLWKTVEKEEIRDVDRLIRESKDELNYLKKLELEVLMIMPGIEKRLIDLENDIYIFEEKYADKLRKSINHGREYLQKRKASISKRAQILFEDIELIAESK